MNRIRRVGVLSLGKVMGLSSFLLSLLIAIPYGLGIILLGVVGGATAEEGSLGFAAFGVGGGLLIMVAIPVLYGVFGFVFGLIYALIINLVLWLADGLEVEIR